MKLTKKLEVEVLKVYKTYWDAYLKGDMKTFASYLDDDLTVFGTAISEVFKNKKETLKFYKTTADQLVGKAQIRNRKIIVTPIDNSFLLNEECDFYALLENKWTYYGRVRISSILRQTGSGWKLAHQHASFPDSRADEGEQIAAEKIKAENLQLRDAVKRRTIELEEKNRELEIESAVERVRAKALAMQNSDDIHEVVRSLRNELFALKLEGVTAVTICLKQVDGRVRYWDITDLELTGRFTADIIFNIEETDPDLWVHKIWRSKKKIISCEQNSNDLKRTLKWLSQYDKKTADEIRELIKVNKIKHGWHRAVRLANGRLITDFVNEPPAEIDSILLKMGAAFDLAYKRFLDLKKAEAQAREAEIQLALERVRARTMAMHTSDEITDTVKLIYQEFDKLNINNESTDIEIGIIDEETGVADVWAHFYLSDGTISKFKFPMKHFPPVREEFNKWKSTPVAKRNELFFTTDISGKSWNQFIELSEELPELAELFSPLKEANITRWITHNAYFSHGMLTLQGTDYYPDETLEIQRRFAKVFEQTYTRFLDLKKAEAQAREAQIETALEKVRSRSMAMHKSKELAETAQVLFQQLQELGGIPDRIGIGIVDEPAGSFDFWSTDQSGRQIDKTFKARLDERTVFSKMYRAWKGNKQSEVVDLQGDDLKEWIQFVRKEAGMIVKDDAIKGRRVHTGTFFSDGWIMVSSHEPQLPETIQILERFAAVFNQTYRRFLDLQKAEAQAREAQIETALERVRARTMGMHQSKDLHDVIETVTNQLLALGINFSNATFCKINPDHSWEMWMSTPQQSYPMDIHVPYFDHPIFRNTRDYTEKRLDFFADVYNEKEARKFLKHFFENTIARNVPEERKQLVLKSKGFARSGFFTKDIWFVISIYEPNLFSKEDNAIIKRFANVFEQSYTRFLDLQKAEAQAREAQIEASLERIRSRTMAMHRSDEIASVVGKIFSELKDLDLVLNRVLIWTFHNDERSITWWSANPEAIDSAASYRIDYNDQPVFLNYLNAWQKRTPLHLYTLSGNLKQAWEDHLFANTELSKLPAPVKKGMREEGTIFTTSTIGDYGLMMVGSFEQLSTQNIDIIQRFGRVFQQSYTRYLDVQKAEAQAREAQIEAALERVRASSMAMHRSADLHEVVKTMTGQLLGVGLKFNVAMFVKDLPDRSLELWIFTPEQPYPSKIHVPFIDHRIFTGNPENETDFYTDIYEQEEKNVFFRHFFENTIARNTPEERKQWVYDQPGFARTLCSTKNLWFGVCVYDLTPFTKEENVIIRRFANVFEQSYTRFLDLQKAEAQAKEARIEISLERIRARALAMHKSDELMEVAIVMREQMAVLGQPDLEASVVHLYEEDPDHVLSWRAFRMEHEAHKEIARGHMPIPKNSCEFIRECLDKFYGDLQEYTIEVSGTKQDELYDVMARLAPDVVNSMRQMNSLHEKRYYRFSKFSGGALVMVSKQEPAAEAIYLQNRAAVVFDLAYRRFLDLQKAEAQAREAQIEAALERVRSRTMAMQRSEELSDVATVLFQQVKALGVPQWACGFCIWDIGDTECLWYPGGPEGEILPSTRFPLTGHEVFRIMDESRKRGDELYILEKEGELQADHYRYMLTLPGVRDLLQGMLDAGVTIPTFQIDHYANFAYGNLIFITYEHFPEMHDIFKRFARVFEQTYTRFLDLQKAEAQTREARIEAALERVRARSMGMQKSDELAEVVAVLYKQFEELDFGFYQVLVSIYDLKKKVIEWWSKGFGGVDLPQRNLIPIIDHAFSNDLLEKWQQGVEYYPHVLEGELKESWEEYLFSQTDLKHFPEEVKSQMRSLESVHLSDVFMKYGSLQAAGPVPLPDDKADILKRFVKVLDLAYTRMIDLQTAETQAREAQIELGLERVRARAMAMQTSDELKELIGTVSVELGKLDILLDRSFIIIYDQQTMGSTWWMANPETPAEQIGLFVQYHEHPAFLAHIQAWKERQLKWQYILEGDNKKEWDKFLFVETELSRLPDFVINNMRSNEKVYLSSSFNNFGYLTLATLEPLTAEQSDIMLRFAKVFDLTYTRFNDLKQAEAQAREAQIQLALERVRARTMAMHSSKELDAVIKTVYAELKKLDITFERCFIMIFDEHKGATWWMGSADDDLFHEGFYVPYHTQPPHLAYLQGWEQRQKKWEYSLVGQVKKDWDEFVFFKTELSKLPPIVIQTMMSFDTALLSASFENFGCLTTGGLEKLSEESFNILNRFAKVFDLSYTRFKDLQKAEAQARESQIQLALERVRARTMAMQQSDELKHAAALLFQQAKALGIPAYSCGYNIWETNEKVFTSWMSTQDGSDFNAVFNIPLTEDANFIRFAESKKNAEEFFVLELRDDRMQEHYDYLKTIPEFKAYFDYAEQMGFSLPETQIHHIANFSHGNLLFITLEPCPEFHDVFKRFAAVFDQTYTRFLDLQMAEAQTKESRIQLALERVRARTMAMQQSNELAEAAQLLYEEFRTLNINTFLCGYCFYKEEKNIQTVWVTRPDGVIIPDFVDFPLGGDHVLDKRFHDWKNKKPLHVLEIKGEENKEHHRFLSSVVADPVAQEIFRQVPDRIIFNCANFSAGYLFIISTEFLTREEEEVIIRFAKVFELTYTRFSDLKQAEAQAREAKIEAALERVRARAMAMHTSQELKDVALELRNQMGTMAQPELEVCAIHLYEESPVYFEAWAAARPPEQEGKIILMQGRFPKQGLRIVDELMEHYHSGKRDYILVNEGEKVPEWLDQLKEQVPDGYEIVMKSLQGTKPEDTRTFWSVADFKGGALVMTTYIPPNEEARKLLRRFSNVFGLAYRRFVDLKQAEAQAKEAQIELALERVRARTMAMHRSEELPETAAELFKQFKELGNEPDRFSIGIINESAGTTDVWATDQAGSEINVRFTCDNYANSTMTEMTEGWKQRKRSTVIDLRGDELKNWLNYVRQVLHMPVAEEQVYGRRLHHLSFFSQGWLNFTTNEPLSGDVRSLLDRFAAVFNLTYTRFADLKKAEAQAKEAQIEAALEKVRSRSLAMHKSNELQEVITTVFDRFRELNIEMATASILISKGDGSITETWIQNAEKTYTAAVRIPYFEESIISRDFKNALDNRKDLFSKQYSREEKNDWFTRCFDHSELGHIPEERKQYVLNGECYCISVASTKHGGIYLGRYVNKPFTNEENSILKRFAKVFEQAYVRFLDLEKAEAQANEARIEISLERIRARALAMHKSGELMEVAKVLREQMAILGQPELEASVVHLYEQDPDNVLSWRAFTEVADSKIVYGHMSIPKNSCEFVREWLANFYSDQQEYTIEMSGAKQEEWYGIMTRLAPDVVKSMVENNTIHEKRYYKFSKFSGGALLMISKQAPSVEASYLQKRAAIVFDLAYRRFADLQKTEAQAREAQIEASLERVRSKTMAMHNSNDVGETVATMFSEFVHLGIHTNRCGILIFDDQNAAEVWTARRGAEEKASLIIGKLELGIHTKLSSAYRAWNAKESAHYYEFQGDDIVRYYEALNHSENYPVKFDLNALPSKEFHSDYFFPEGEVFAITAEPLSEEHSKILKRFAGVFGQTYRRYLDLQKAEAQAREAQIEASLERVRSKTMAMHNSNDVGDTVATMFAEFVHLGIQTNRCGILIFDDKNSAEVWTARRGAEEKATLIIGKLDLGIHAMLSSAQKAWESKVPVHYYEFHDEDIVRYYEAINKSEFYPVKFDINALPKREFHSDFFFPEGAVFAFTAEKLSEEHSKILKRFAGVFGQTYRRYLDLQKAEAQAREAQIEVSLERVRAKAMAMHSSKDLSETLTVFYRELKSLGVTPRRCGIALMDKEERLAEVTTMNTTEQGDSIEVIGKIRMSGHKILDDVYENWQKQNEYHAVLRGNEIKEYYQVLKPQMDFPDYSNDAVQYGYYFMFNEGDVYAWTEHELTEDELRIYRRFTKVISLTYKRYKDLRQAEAQAREAQIEAGLERVRARTMAMHNSRDVTSATETMFEEFKKLGIDNLRCGIANIHLNRTFDVFGVTNLPDGNRMSGFGLFGMDEHAVWQRWFESWTNKDEVFIAYLEGKEKEEYFQNINDHHNYLPQRIVNMPDNFFQAYYFEQGSVWAYSLKEHTPAEKDIMKRFATGFSLTFRRYQDLQKAEAQAKEAQIETGLERVRARTMAMHSSDDVGAATAIMFTELEKLGIENRRGGITIISPDQTQEVWSINNMANGEIIRAIGVFDMRKHGLWRQLFESWQNKKDYDYYPLTGKDKEDYIAIINTTPNYLSQPIKEIPDVHVQSYFFGEGAVWTNSLQPHTEEDKQIMKRFASVFSLTFRRYQDLKKAEAQAREATIEAALERVRGKAMAMHSSKDLADTIGVFYHELAGLNLTPRRCGVGLINKESHVSELSTMNTTEEGQTIELIGHIDLRTHPVLERVYDNWLTKTEYHPVLRGNEIKEYYQVIRPQMAFPDYTNDEVQYGYFFYFEEGGVYAWTEKELQEDELKIYRRFTSVLSLTYKRYRDLKDAEQRAQNAIKEAALDRIRADIASMRTVEDLDRITPLIWNELTTLDIPFIRCGVFIMDEIQKIIHTFLSTPDGKAIAAFHLPYDTPGNFADMLDHWYKKKTYISRWSEADFIGIADTLVKQGAIISKEQYLGSLPKGGFYLHFIPFIQGMLYVGNMDQLSDEQIELIQHVADAFSTAYARYEDFNKLEAAKQQVENTLNDLKQAQQQLVQSEKMASLGELTAGIAHEIQNPLNFVNNFSDVSNELLEEMKNELEKGNKEDAIAIVDDVKQNLEKILHHGKRADAIVKGMLQHSRTSSGQKELIDINILADEYLRLAYHGLRAKDKSFNAKFETHFDESIGKVNVIPQEIGRVILNLINNAFYTVTEKKKHVTNGYEPTVTVTTQKDNGRIEIKVKDNGNGIPPKILDKIFQPFFTTKPTGQGTGLGLSLAYDIITKGHGGDLKVETKEGEGSEFIIQLSAS